MCCESMRRQERVAWQMLRVEVACVPQGVSVPASQGLCAIGMAMNSSIASAPGVFPVIVESRVGRSTSSSKHPQFPMRGAAFHFICLSMSDQRWTHHQQGSRSQSATMSQAQKSPTDFLSNVIGRPVVVKLNSGVNYHGIHLLAASNNGLGGKALL